MKNTVFKLLYHLGIPSLLRTKKKGTITVLCLHRISDERDYFFNPIKIQTFILLIDYLAKHYTIIAFSEVEKSTPKPKLILSFDDGYYDFIENVLPILKKKGLPSNHNIVNSCVNNNSIIWTQRLNDIFNYLKDHNITNNLYIKDVSTFENNWTSYYLSFLHHLLNIEKESREKIISSLEDSYNVKSDYRMMNWDEINYIANNDVEIGSHTYNHDSLSTIKDFSVFTTEITKSIEEISNNINRNVNILSLPNGSSNLDLMMFLKTSPIKHVLLVDDKINMSTVHGSPAMISRIYLMDNPIHETILRTELFHSIIKR
ncbi:MAG: polysaccharide deacetylase family protein [Crocinitomicaceae bacterium]